MELPKKTKKQSTQQSKTHTPKKRRRWYIHTKRRANNGAMDSMDQKQFQIPPGQETPDIDHITEEDWGKIEQATGQQSPPEIDTPRTAKNTNFPRISKDLQHIRKQAPLTQAIKNHPQINKWLAEDYTEDEIEKQYNN